MPQRGDAELLQILSRQVRENRLVYVILAEDRLILPEAKAAQPDNNVHDDAPQSRVPAHHRAVRGECPGGFRGVHLRPSLKTRYAHRRWSCLARFSCEPAPTGGAAFWEQSLVAIQRPFIICAARSAITMVGAFVFPLVIVGIIEASTTRRFFVPRTRRKGSTTAC